MNRSRAVRRVLAPLCAAALLLGLGACGDTEEAASSEGTLVIYSGRNESLVGPLLERLEDVTGIPVAIRYGTSSEMAAQLLEEGEGTDADLFFSQDAGALGALAKAGRLTSLDEKTTSAVSERFRDTDGHWVATSARARVLAYDPEQVPDIASVHSVDAVLAPQWKGKVGYAPTNASFQAFVTALRVTRGEDGARSWLEQFKATDPQAYGNNLQVLDAVDSGDIALGLINHYYWFERVAELGADKVNAKIHYLDSDDAGALINVAGVGVLQGSDQSEAALEAVEFLLSEEAQQYFADTTAEYPVVEGITSTEHDLIPLEELRSPTVDLNDLDSLDVTLKMLDEVGLT